MLKMLPQITQGMIHAHNWGNPSIPLQVNADGSQVAMSFRYVIQPGAKVNAFRPKDLVPADDKMNLRAGQFGALWNGKFNQMPRASHCDVVWEAPCSKKNCTTPPIFPQLLPR